MFENEIKKYEDIRKEYHQKIADRIGKAQWMEYNEILFSANSCAIEGNSFTVDDTRKAQEWLANDVFLIIQAASFHQQKCQNHYLIANLALVGEAIILAMRTSWQK